MTAWLSDNHSWLFFLLAKVAYKYSYLIAV